MIKLENISTDSSIYPWVEQLWLNSFPDDERRDTIAQRLNTDTNPIFSCFVALDDYDKPLGFITLWNFDLFIYCEHFAAAPEFRCKGIGTKIINHITNSHTKPLVLEVEIPDNELSRRRIRFYERCGLRLWQSSHYIQPPYRAGGNSVPMMLMATEGLDEHTDFNHVVDTLKKYVYGIRNCI